MIRKLLTLGLATWLAAGAGSLLAQDAVDESAGERKAQPCLSCHGLDHFAQYSRQELQAAVQSIVAGESAHMPLPPFLTEQDLAEIVVYLSKASAAD